jgi:primosomal protein N' (replication factor Y)
MTVYADVALPVAIEKTFTYLIPPELHESAVVGARAIVPFGRKYATGLIVALPLHSIIPSLKPVKDIIDPAPVVSTELLRLCHWIAGYYFAPIGEVLKAAIPHGFSQTSKRLVRLARGADNGSHPPTRARILSLLAERGPMLSGELQRRIAVKSIHAVLNDMAREGLIDTEEIVPRPAQRARTMEFVRLDQINHTRLAHELASLSPRKVKGRRLLTVLLSLLTGRSEIPLPDLLKHTGASTATVKEFRTSGLLPIVRREITRQQEYGTEEQTRSIVLNAAQQTVLRPMVESMDGGTHKTFLLHGVTGSGKTQVYIEAIRHCLARKRSAIVLVPEISLTPQIVRRFKSHFANEVAVVHSRMSVGERYDVWRLALRGDYRVVIGPRSAIFAPLKDLGLIVVDEEHEASYKQFDAVPRYHARDVATVRGSMNNAVVVLGSATPSAESFFNATGGKYELLRMPDRIDGVPMPSIAVVDMTAERKREYAARKEALAEPDRRKLREFQQSSFSVTLREKILDRLARREGIILLQNRRGFAPFVECMDCGYAESCSNCNVTLTYHLTKKHLRCHYCGLIRTPHTHCPQCNGITLQLRGIGTQRVEQELGALFPGAKVLRMDLDTTSRKGAHDRLLRKFGDRNADILLGTQMVAKGLDFPHVTLVGVISADTQMLLPDFRSSEKTFQLLTQVAGRAGRSTLKGEVIIQTHQPGHYTLQHVIDHDFASFFEQEMKARQELDYPPFSRLALVEVKGLEEPKVRHHAERFFNALTSQSHAVTLLGPSPAVIGKINNQYRWHIILKSPKRTDPSGTRLHAILREAHAAMEKSVPRSVRLTIDIDPAGLM